MSTQTSTIQKLALHNLDAIVAILALPVFALTGLPLEGWFWAVALWAVNRSLQVLVERRAVPDGARSAPSACWARACCCGPGSGCCCCS